MASFSTHIKSKFELETYKGAKDTYEWIIASLNKLNSNYEKIEVSFQFDIGTINCSCNSVEEFIEYAYGQADYDLTCLSIIYRSDSNIYITVRRYDGVRISTDSKVLLEEIISILESHDIKQNENITNNYIQNNYEIGTISGDNNAVVQGNNSNITQQKVEKSTLKEWIEAILQNLVANWLWIVIPIIIATIIGFLSNR